MNGPKLEILVVEDEEHIRTGVCDVLAYHGFLPTGVETGTNGLAQGGTGRFALIVLDVMLPELDGFEVCRALRARLPEQPILMLTAKGAEDDVLHGFACGADDYVCKPFSVRELVARVEALLRRAGKLRSATESPFAFGPWRIDPETRRATAGGSGGGREDVELTRRELDVIALFVRERGRIVSRRRLLRDVWELPNADGLNTRTVDMHIAKLRKKIDPAGAGEGQGLIETVRGEGYRYR